MALSVRNDPKRFSGGHAILEGPGLAGVAILVVEDAQSGLFLAPDGRWAKQPHGFAVQSPEGAPSALSIGPDIVDAIPTESYLKLSSGQGTALGSLLWIDVIPSRSRRDATPPPASAPAPVETPSVVAAPPPEPPPPRSPEPVVPTPAAAPAAPRRLKRALAVGLVVIALLAFITVVAFLLSRTKGQDQAGLVQPIAAEACAAFGGQTMQIDARPDADRVKLAEDALSAGCGAQAFGILESTDWESNEAAAWYLARFYDPNETGTVFHQAAMFHPDWAASYYARWAARSPRHATALKALCASNGSAFDNNAQLKRACTR